MGYKKDFWVVVNGLGEIKELRMEKEKKQGYL